LLSPASALVRPDLAIVSGAMLVGAWLIYRRAGADRACRDRDAPADPSFEIFRAGSTARWCAAALAKSASGSNWGRGWAYLVDSSRRSRCGSRAWRSRVARYAAVTSQIFVVPRSVIVLAPIVAAVVMVIYVRAGRRRFHVRRGCYCGDVRARAPGDGNAAAKGPRPRSWSSHLGAAVRTRHQRSPQSRVAQPDRRRARRLRRYTMSAPDRRRIVHHRRERGVGADVRCDPRSPPVLFTEGALR